MKSYCVWDWLLCFIWQIPVAVEDFSQDGVVRFLGHRAFPPCMESRKVPLHHLYHALPRFRLLSNAGGNHTNELALYFFELQQYIHLHVCLWRQNNKEKKDYLTNKSGCAKKSAYISNKDLLSRMKVGRTTCKHNMEARLWNWTIVSKWKDEVIVSIRTGKHCSEETINRNERGTQKPAKTEPDHNAADLSGAFTFVRSMPRRTWERRCMMTLLCSSTDSPSGSSSRSSWLSKGSQDNKKRLRCLQ